MDYVAMAKVLWPLLAAAAAWGGAKQALNGTRDRVKKLEERSTAHDTVHTNLLERTARMETKIDILLEKK